MINYMQKAKQALDNLVHWIAASSANPQGVSLTVRGALLGSIPALMYVVGVAHLNLGQDQITAVFDAATGFLQSLLTVVATGLTLYGAMRKVWLSIFAAPSSTPQG